VYAGSIPTPASILSTSSPLKLPQDVEHARLSRRRRPNLSTDASPKRFCDGPPGLFSAHEPDSTWRKLIGVVFSSVPIARQESGEALGMSKSASSGKSARAGKAFWRNNAFWFVVMPTSLVALVFVLGMITKAMGQ